VVRRNGSRKGVDEAVLRLFLLLYRRRRDARIRGRWLGYVVLGSLLLVLSRERRWRSPGGKEKELVDKVLWLSATARG
jgi:hypothetical protein